MEIPVTLLISTGSLICAVMAAVAAFKSRNKDDGKSAGVMLTEIGYIKSGIDDLKRQQEKTEERYVELTGRLTSVEASAKQAHRRLDDHIMKGEK